MKIERAGLLFRLVPIWLIFIFFMTSLVNSGRQFSLDQTILSSVEKKHGKEALLRLRLWEKLIVEDNSASDRDRLRTVNDFFNRRQWVRDILLWKENDYWATPIEFLAVDGGDCEDFSIAKYFTLRALGMPEEKLYITYVKALKINEAHMVLAYYETPQSEPLILDNMIKDIKPAGQRKDLLPVYRFNGSSLWLAKQRGGGKFIGESTTRMKRWRDVLNRMPDSLK